MTPEEEINHLKDLLAKANAAVEELALRHCNVARLLGIPFLNHDHAWISKEIETAISSLRAQQSVPPEARAVAKGNRAKIAVVMELTDAILADVKEKNQMIDAEETHGAEWGEREDDFGEAQQILEELQGQLNRLDYLL